MLVAAVGEGGTIILRSLCRDHSDHHFLRSGAGQRFTCKFCLFVSPGTVRKRGVKSSQKEERQAGCKAWLFLQGRECAILQRGFGIFAESSL